MPGPARAETLPRGDLITPAGIERRIATFFPGIDLTKVQPPTVLGPIRIDSTERAGIIVHSAVVNGLTLAEHTHFTVPQIGPDDRPIRSTSELFGGTEGQYRLLLTTLVDHTKRIRAHMPPNNGRPEISGSLAIIHPSHQETLATIFDL